MGLAISRNLVELMGGILSVRSEVEKGSEFFFTIKLPVYEKQFEKSWRIITKSDYIVI